MSKCCWVMTPAQPGVPAVYCHAKCKYRTVWKDWGKRERVYNSFCEEHQRIVDKSNDEQDTAD